MLLKLFFSVAQRSLVVTLSELEAEVTLIGGMIFSSIG